MTCGPHHVTSPLQEQLVPEAAFTPCHALQEGVQRKLASNLPSCLSAGIECIPVVAETLGGLVHDTINIVKDICRAISDHGYGIDLHSTTRHLFHSLAISLWRETLRYGSTVPHPPSFREMGWCSPFYFYLFCTIFCFAFVTSFL